LADCDFACTEKANVKINPTNNKTFLITIILPLTVRNVEGEIHEIEPICFEAVSDRPP
jgi:hypothetical protein